MSKGVLFLVVLVLAFVGFIVTQAIKVGGRSRPTTVVAPETSSATTVSTEDGNLVRVRTSSLPPPPPKDYAAIDRAINESREPVTYIADVLRNRGGNIARWVDRSNNPITVWIQPRTTVKDFWPDYRNLARDAFYTWSAAGIPVRFLFIDDSSSAEVRVRWVFNFPDRAAGKTYWARDINWWILGADIELALHSQSGEAYDKEAVHAIAIHEVGHLIGLDHSSNAENVMAARVRTLVLSPMDLRTANLIYRLPPGPTKEAGK
jgi:hypothetical protein